MDHLETLLSRLSSTDLCGYQPRGPAATEPTALAALALLAHGRDLAAQPLVERLLQMQNDDGSLGICPLEPRPGWPTGWAVLAWQAAQASSIFNSSYAAATDRGIDWIMSTRGASLEKIDWQGHDTTIQGWPWVIGTHAWVEPTAISLLALRHGFRDQHPRTRQASLLLVDRLLAHGGCNYGNTVVLGQELRPHVEPTGLCLLALGDNEDSTGRIAKSVAYLRRELSDRTPTLSLCYGLLGLAARRAYPDQASNWLDASAHRTLRSDPAAHKLALLALASQGEDSPLITRNWRRNEVLTQETSS